MPFPNTYFHDFVLFCFFNIVLSIFPLIKFCIFLLKNKKKDPTGSPNEYAWKIMHVEEAEGVLFCWLRCRRRLSRHTYNGSYNLSQIINQHFLCKYCSWGWAGSLFDQLPKTPWPWVIILASQPELSHGMGS